MAKGTKGAAAAAASAAAEASSGVPPNIAHGVCVTLGFFLLYYGFLFAQATLKRKLRAHYAAQGKKVRVVVRLNTRVAATPGETCRWAQDQILYKILLFFLSTIRSRLDGSPGGSNNATEGRWESASLSQAPSLARGTL